MQSLREIQSLAERACIRLRMEEKQYTDGEQTWTSVCISFKKIPDCPQEGDERGFSRSLQNLLLGISQIDREFIDLHTTPADESTPSGGNLGTLEIHSDGRRQADGAFPPGSFPWVIVHELAHFYYAPFPGKAPDEEDKEAAEKEIRLTNRIQKELGQDCWRYPDHGIEVFICPVPPNKLKAVKVTEDGTVEKEAPIDVGADPNPIVPFTGGQRLAGPDTF